MACCIAVSKPDSLCCELIDVRCIVKRASITANVRPTEIIDEKEDDVRLACFGGLNRGGYEANRDDEGSGEGECLYSCHVKNSGER